ncbi:MAG: hypothetical protein A2091_10565 [Desulfuromonadales bacterium GWD2_61_12]|nr:MAG: hypothetical protein A2005_11810 [Desulfuromonadales bacterium GWC2_61_20]OGR35054.1 MAG: hypothetical protein A2091_10565 [Desulfuromonadales bacterium GWD2_61_12]HBT82331.1 hypothetical protein [Desulfuromonas sp.]
MKVKIPNSLILVAVASVTAVAAYLLTVSGQHEPVQTLFLAFVAAILAIQVIPALILFVGLIKGLFTRAEKSLER